jgi:serine/threonine protein kinase
VSNHPTTFGPYRLEQLLGRGGMGEVFRAYDTEHQRTVAVKRLTPHLADDPDFQLRFRREAHNVAQLSNPHIVPIHKYGEIDGRLYIDMRFVEGGDLDDLVRAGGALPFDRAVRMVEQIASGLDAAHAIGLVHRDVKPSNVLLDGQVADFCYLADFGITKAASAQRSRSLTNTGALVGSLAYMAPEQFNGEVTKRSDVYALACVFFELITGRTPYEGQGLLALMHAHTRIPPPLPSRVNPGTAMFDDVITVGMAKDAGGRFASAGSLARTARAAVEAHRSRATILPTRRPVDHDPAPGPPEPPAARTEQVIPPRQLRPPVAAPADTTRTVPHALPPTPRPALPARGGQPTSGPPRAAEPASRAADAGPTPTRSRRRWLVALTTVVLAVALVAGGWVVVQRYVIGSVPEGMFAGRNSDGSYTIAIGVNDGHAVGYVCNGDTDDAWLEGSVSGSRITLHNKAGQDLVTADVQDQRSVFGMVLAGGISRSFSADVVVDRAELFQYVRHDDEGKVAERIGWIVLAGGEQVGIRAENGMRGPAPMLDRATLQATDGGVPVPAEQLTGASTVILP